MIAGMILSPAYTYPDQLATQLRQQGYAVLSPQAVCEIAGCALADLMALRPSWDDLPPDSYLKDGGHYRRRRHSCFVVEGEEVEQAPHRAHWQPRGIQRPARRHAALVRADGARRRAAAGLAATAARAGARVSSELKGERPWYRRGAPVPHRHRGRHRPAHAGRRAPRRRRPGGGVPGRPRWASRAARRACSRPTARPASASRLTEPWSLLLLDDERVIHESTPIQPVAAHGHRDTLVLTYRAGGFQGS